LGKNRAEDQRPLWKTMAVDLEKLRSAAQRVAASHGLDVVDLDFAGGGKFRALRIFIEKNAAGRAKLAEAAKAAQEAIAAGATKKRSSAEAERLLTQGKGQATEEHIKEDIENDTENDVAPEDLEDLGALPSAVLTGELSIEHLSGVTHEDCEQFSRDFGTLLDVEDLVPGTEYTLEVSSPGLERKLARAEDYERFKGSLVKLQTFTPVNGNRHWKGRIQTMSDGKLELDLAQEKRKPKKQKEQSSASMVVIELSNVEKANLVPEF
jgi:ribosome maturation factor RimP